MTSYRVNVPRRLKTWDLWVKTQNFTVPSTAGSRSFMFTSVPFAPKAQGGDMKPRWMRHILWVFITAEEP